MGCHPSIVGEVSERPKEHAWKVCMGKLIEGSNPSLSAIKIKRGPWAPFFLFLTTRRGAMRALRLDPRDERTDELFAPRMSTLALCCLTSGATIAVSFDILKATAPC